MKSFLSRQSKFLLLVYELKTAKGYLLLKNISLTITLGPKGFYVTKS